MIRIFIHYPTREITRAQLQPNRIIKAIYPFRTVFRDFSRHAVDKLLDHNLDYGERYGSVGNVIIAHMKRLH